MPWHRGTNTHGATAHDSGVCCASPLRHLRAGAATHSGGAAGRCYPYVDSRFSLKQRSCFLYGGMASAQGFLSTWSLEPTAIPEEVDRVVSGTAPGSWCCCRQDPATRRGGPGASTKDKPANDRPSPRSVLVHTSTHFSRCAGAESQLLPQQGAGGRRSVADGGGRGPLPFKAKEFVSCYLSM